MRNVSVNFRPADYQNNGTLSRVVSWQRRDDVVERIYVTVIDPDSPVEEDAFNALARIIMASLMGGPK